VGADCPRSRDASEVGVAKSVTINAIVVIAASAGGLAPLRRIINALPPSCGASVFEVVHIGSHRSLLPSLLRTSGNLPVAFAEDGAPVEPGHIYVAPSDYHMVLEANRIRLNRDAKVHYTRPAADPLFASAAEVYGERVVGVVLSGGDGDGAAGLRRIKKRGGMALVQRPDDAAEPSMPRTAIEIDHPDACLPVEEIAQRVAGFCMSKNSLSAPY
jgi:two-component system chemotaxis response regulator CheB